MIPPAQLPPPVRPGDRVGVAALSGPVVPERLERGLAELRRLGFEPVPAPNLAARDGLFAGTAEARLAGLYALADDPSIRGVVFARGGHGVLPLLPRIDWQRLAEHPRAWVGYSDLTPFLLEVVRRLRLVAFHGPMVAADLARGLAAEEAASLVGALGGDLPKELPLAGGEGEVVTGVLLGGCLSLLTASLGTPWAVDLEGAVLMWEDVDEPLYRLDRMLTQLHLSHRLAGIRGMVIGHADPTDVPESPASVLRASVRRVTGGDAGAPAMSLAWGLPAGHRAPNLTLPLGLTARLEPAAARLLLRPEPAGSAPR